MVQTVGKHDRPEPVGNKEKGGSVRGTEKEKQTKTIPTSPTKKVEQKKPSCSGRDEKTGEQKGKECGKKSVEKEGRGGIKTYRWNERGKKQKTWGGGVDSK